MQAHPRPQPAHLLFRLLAAAQDAGSRLDTLALAVPASVRVDWHEAAGGLSSVTDGCIRSTWRSAPRPGNAAQLRRTRDPSRGKVWGCRSAARMLGVSHQTVAPAGRGGGCFLAEGQACAALGGLDVIGLIQAVARTCFPAEIGLLPIDCVLAQGRAWPAAAPPPQAGVVREEGRKKTGLSWDATRWNLRLSAVSWRRT